MKKLVSTLALLVAAGLTNVAYAGTWWCYSGGTSAPGTGNALKLDKVEITYNGTNAYLTGSFVSDPAFGCTNGYTFTWNWDLSVQGTKEAHATFLAAFLSNSDVCVSVISCTSGAGPRFDGVQIRR